LIMTAKSKIQVKEKVQDATCTITNTDANVSEVIFGDSFE